ncbi:MAG: sorbosone dehydrogenase family protein, partial [Acidobacteriaceae bacterium]|nr:sorbosone dehydrogenase family protein [Acidobacteriaceae bacterium]
MLKTSLRTSRRLAPLAVGFLFCSVSVLAQSPPSGSVITGKAAFTDYSKEAPGVIRKLRVADLPAPYATKSVDNGPNLVKRPENAWPKAPAGFKVDLYYTGLDQPRLIRTAPNGDLFVAISYQ